MKIETINIKSFGAFKDKEISFGLNYNTLIEHNEFGKSTLVELIKTSLYGFNKIKGYMYLPYSGEDIEYTLNFTFKNKSYSINRKLSTRVTSSITGEKRANLANREVFEYLGIEEIPSNIWIMDADSNEELKNFIDNATKLDLTLYQAIEYEGKSFDEAISILNERKKDLYTARKNSTSVYYKNLNKISVINDKKKKAVNEEQNKKSDYKKYMLLENKLKSLDKELIDLEEKIERTKNLNIKNEIIKKYKEVNARIEFNNLKEDIIDVEEYKLLKEEKEQLQEYINNTDSTYFEVYKNIEDEKELFEHRDNLNKLSEVKKEKEELEDKYLNTKIENIDLLNIKEELDEYNKNKNLLHLYEDDSKYNYLFIILMNIFIIPLFIELDSFIKYISYFLATLSFLFTIYYSYNFFKSKKDKKDKYNEITKSLFKVNELKKIKVFNQEYNYNYILEIINELSDLTIKEKRLENLVKHVDIDYDIFDFLDNYSNVLKSYSKYEDNLARKEVINSKIEIIENRYLEDYKTLDLEKIKSYNNKSQELFKQKDSILNQAISLQIDLNDDIIETEVLQDLERNLVSKRTEKDNSIIDITNIKNNLNMYSSDNIDELEADKEELTRENEAIMDEYDELEQKIVALTKAKEYIKEKIQPRYINRANEILNKIVLDDHIVLSLDADSNIIFTDRDTLKNISFINISAGTKAQILLALKLAYLDEVDEKKIYPVVIDDAFMAYDGRRKNRVIELLKKYSLDRQVIYLTKKEWKCLK